MSNNTRGKITKIRIRSVQELKRDLAKIWVNGKPTMKAHVKSVIPDRPKTNKPDDMDYWDWDAGLRENERRLSRQDQQRNAYNNPIPLRKSERVTTDEVIP